MSIESQSVRGPYCSATGARELAAFRVGQPPEVTTGHAPIELLARLPSEECGCPEELWQVDGLVYLIHMEAAAGTGEVFVFAGDWEAEHSVQAPTIDHLRAEMFARHASAMRLPEHIIEDAS